MNWKEGIIQDVIIEPFKVFADDRGWLSELFRSDETDSDAFPAMGYLSVTHPDTARGPHEHVSQSDRFAFFHGHYRVFLWDARKHSDTQGLRHVFDAGGENPVVVVVPPGVVHAYKNVGSQDAYVLNFPNQLYAGEGKQEEVDEIRHEDQSDSPFKLEW